MTYRGVFSHRNLHGSEKVQDKDRSNVHGKPANHPPYQFITINGDDYFVKYVGGNYSSDNRLNQFNNKTVDVEGTFIGTVMLITSIVKVGP